MTMTKILRCTLATSLCVVGIACSFSAIAAMTSDVVSTPVATSTSAQSLTPAQTKQFEGIIHDYLLNNPKVIVEAIQGMQKQEEQKYIGDIKAQIPGRTQELFDTKSPGREVIGSKAPHIIIAELFSYQCPNCRVMPPIIDKLIDFKKNIQVHLIGWTFEGNDDVYAAKIDLAAKKQGKYYDLYKALMKEPGALTKDSIEKVAKASGLDMDKLHKDLDDSAIDKALAGNFKLAKDLHLVGTPTFIITNKTFSKYSVIFGRASEADLQKAIDEVW